MNSKLVPALYLASVLLAACSAASTSQADPVLTVKASGLKYQPALVEVTAGQPVRLTFENEDAMEHDLSVVEIPLTLMSADSDATSMPGHDMSGMADVPDLHVAAGMGQNASVEFTPSKPGTYEFYCTVPGHKEAGMVGTLVVKAP